PRRDSSSPTPAWTRALPGTTAIAYRQRDSLSVHALLYAAVHRPKVTTIAVASAACTGGLSTARIAPATSPHTPRLGRYARRSANAGPNGPSTFAVSAKAAKNHRARNAILRSRRQPSAIAATSAASQNPPKRTSNGPTSGGIPAAPYE